MQNLEFQGKEAVGHVGRIRAALNMTIESCTEALQTNYFGRKSAASSVCRSASTQTGRQRDAATNKRADPRHVSCLRREDPPGSEWG